MLARRVCSSWHQPAHNRGRATSGRRWLCTSLLVLAHLAQPLWHIYALEARPMSPPRLRQHSPRPNHWRPSYAFPPSLFALIRESRRFPLFSLHHEYSTHLTNRSVSVTPFLHTSCPLGSRPRYDFLGSKYLWLISHRTKYSELSFSHSPC